jgi:GTP-binding protein HflX
LKKKIEITTARRAAIVAVQFPNEDIDEIHQSLDELTRLVETRGDKVVTRVVQKRDEPSPSHYIGKGKVEEMFEELKILGCTLVVFDNELSGGQQNNLEKILKIPVIDRTKVIIDIFEKHARTKESKSQVELARLQYQISHLTKKWTHLERQKGGIGMRGVGERQIELDRRMIRTKISKLKEEIKHTAEVSATQRKHRDRFLRVAIVGYTNAGKSTLMNGLTDSEVYVDDRLFATLDSTVRLIDPKTRPPILLSDTVGFIKKLPTNLIASFRSTLQEALEADLILHVVDLSSPNYLEQIEVTRKTLDEIGAGERPSILVFNKADLVKEVFLPQILQRKYVDSVVVSALRPSDMKRLRTSIYNYFEKDMLELEVLVPYKDTWLQSQIHEFSKVIKKDYLDEGALFKIRILRTDASWLRLINDAKT